MSWIKKHGAALVALAGALGAATAALDPGLSAEVTAFAGAWGPAVGIVGAVVHAYVTAATGEGK